MKRICFLCGDINRVGGTERVTTVVANALAKEGYQVLILSINNGLNTFFKIEKEVRTYSLGMEGKSSNFSNIAITKQLHNFLKTHDIDYCIDVDIVLSFYSIPAVIGIKTKIISWEHFNFLINVGGSVQKLKRSIARRLASKFACHIITLTNKDREFYIKRLNCKDKAITIHNPITLSQFTRADLNIKKVVAIGRLVHQKGFDLLLKSWQQVQKHNADWQLIIVGSGEKEIELKALSSELRINNTVQFIPATREVNFFYANASIYAMPSRFEGLPLALIEAKAFGLPIISFDCDCGPSDIIRNGIDGILVEKENCEQFSAALLELMNDEDRRHAFGENAFNDRSFALDVIISQWQAILV